MGQPVKILELARDLILLSGLRPEIDIPIVITGVRPGEKLYEELRALREICEHRDRRDLVLRLKECVPEYNPSSLMLRKALAEAQTAAPESARRPVVHQVRVAR